MAMTTTYLLIAAAVISATNCQNYGSEIANILQENTKAISSLQEQVLYLQNDLSEVNEEHQALKTHLNHLKLKAKQEEFIGFTAFATEPRSYEVDQIVLFDGVITNYGGWYNPGVSTFVCPINGYYLFIIHLFGLNGENAGADIYLDGVGSLVRVYVDTNSDEGSANQVVTYCNLGQLVWVRSYLSAGALYGGAAPDARTTFSGILLQTNSTTTTFPEQLW